MPKLTQEELEALVSLYSNAREKLLDTIIYYKGVGTKTYANEILRRLQQELFKLQRESAKFIEIAIPREYQTALQSTYRYFKRNHLRMLAPSSFADVHADAAYEIAREMQYQISSGLAHVGRQILRYVDSTKDELLRKSGLRASGEKIASGGTVQDMRNALLRELEEKGFMTVQYGAGSNQRQTPIDVYVDMVSRSTSREATNTATLNQLTLNGYDLVKMSTHYPTCSMCARHQGRVFSISGKDSRFPPLSKAFGAYNNIHPNCRHVAGPWIESLKDAREIEETIKFSNRPFADSRSAGEIELYNLQQNKNRKARNDLYQYERYKKRLGEGAPESLMAFERIKKKGGESWENLQIEYRKVHSI